MKTKSGCGRLDPSAFGGQGARPAWPVVAETTAWELRTWLPAELDRPDLAPLFEPRPN